MQTRSELKKSHLILIQQNQKAVFLLLDVAAMKQCFNLSIRTIKFRLHWLLCWMLSRHLNNTMSVAEPIHFSGIAVPYISWELGPGFQQIDCKRSSPQHPYHWHTWMSASLVTIQNDCFTVRLKGILCFLWVSFTCFPGLAWSEDGDVRFWWHQDDNAGDGQQQVITIFPPKSCLEMRRWWLFSSRAALHSDKFGKGLFTARKLLAWLSGNS